MSTTNPKPHFTDDETANLYLTLRAKVPPECPRCPGRIIVGTKPLTPPVGHEDAVRFTCPACHGSGTYSAPIL